VKTRIRYSAMVLMFCFVSHALPRDRAGHDIAIRIRMPNKMTVQREPDHGTGPPPEQTRFNHKLDWQTARPGQKITVQTDRPDMLLVRTAGTNRSHSLPFTIPSNPGCTEGRITLILNTMPRPAGAERACVTYTLTDL